MPSSVEIANQALTKLGADRIISFSDETTEATTMATLYESEKESLLRMYPWNCATKRATLALLSAEPVNEYPYQYALPDGCLRVLDAWSGDYKMVKQGDGRRAWVVEGQRLLCNEQNVAIQYIQRIDESEMDSLFVDVLIAKLAAEAAYTIQASGTAQSNFFQLYMQKLEEARTVDNLESSHTTFHIDKLRTVRY